MSCPSGSVCVATATLIGVLSGAVSAIGAETIITPSVATSAIYMSNIGLSSTTGGASGGDIMLAVSPSVAVSHSGQLMSGSFFAGVAASRFIENPEFSFVSTSGGFTLNLDGLVKRLSPRLSLSVSDAVSYTPQQPAFLVPQGEESGPQGVDFRGIQAARANALTNAGTVNGVFTVSPLVGLTASYSNTLSRFSNPIAQPGVGGFLDTTSESVFAGPRFTVTRNDTVTAGYSYSKSSFDAGGPGVQTTNFETHGGSVSWSHTFSPQIAGSLSGNYSLVTPGNVGVYGGSASLSYRVLNTTTASIAYSRQVMPSFFVAGLPLVSNTVSVAVSHNVSQKLSGSLTVAYAESSSTSTGTTGQGDLSFDSYMASSGLSYVLSQAVSATASYSYAKFNQEFSGMSTSFDIHTVMLSLIGRWPYKWS